MHDTPHAATNVTIRSALLAGVAIGAAVAVALPALVRRLRGGAAETGTGAADKGENGTHAVRAGASVRIPRGELTEVVAACLQAAGATAAHAQASAEVLVFADCRGIPSHGVNRADFYAAELEDKLVDGAAEPMVAVDSGCCALVDGRNALGAVVIRRATKPNPNSDPDPSPNPNSHSPLPKPNQVCRRAMELAIAKAREHGVGWVVCKGSNHFGAAGYWAEQAWAVLTVWPYSLCGRTHCGHTHCGYTYCGHTHCGYTHCGYTYYGGLLGGAGGAAASARLLLHQHGAFHGAHGRAHTRGGHQADLLLRLE